MTAQQANHLQQRRGQLRREWRSLTPEQRQQRAINQYNRTWQAASKLYGAQGHPAPRMSIPGTPLGRGAYAQVQFTPGGRVVELSPGLVKRLAKPKLLMAPKGKAEQREKLLHEWAHVFQDPSLVRDPNPNHREEAAQLFSDYFGHKLFGSVPEPRKSGPLPYQNRRAASRDLAATYGPGYWRGRQFGANYGANPTGIAATRAPNARPRRKRAPTLRQMLGA